jgi:hypothetical protein
LPHGGNLSDEDVSKLAVLIKDKIEVVKQIGRVQMTEAAKEAWTNVYPDLSAERPGMLGAVTARSEAQTIRLALVYALLDGVGEIDVKHLNAALALWEYCEASAEYIFGDMLGDPLADEITVALRQAGSAGMTRTAIRDLFGRNQSSDRIGAALALLVTNGRARMETRATGGRPAEIWIATGTKMATT